MDRSNRMMRNTGGLNLGEILFLVAGVIGVLHHVDHILRFDHSGWPFRGEVNAFTYSLVIYPVALGIFAMPRRSLARVLLAFVVFLAPTLAHVFIETPAHQYLTWAMRPDVNLLGVEAPPVGAFAVIVTILLSTISFAAFAAFFWGWWTLRSTDGSDAASHDGSSV